MYASTALPGLFFGLELRLWLTKTRGLHGGPCNNIRRGDKTLTISSFGCYFQRKFKPCRRSKKHIHVHECIVILDTYALNKWVVNFLTSPLEVTTLNWFLNFIVEAYLKSNNFVLVSQFMKDSERFTPKPVHPISLVTSDISTVRSKSLCNRCVIDFCDVIVLNPFRTLGHIIEPDSFYLSQYLLLVKGLITLSKLSIKVIHWRIWRGFAVL